MTRTLAKSTVKRLQTRLESERDRLQALIEEREQQLEEARLSEGAADRSPDPASAEAGSMAFEYEKELSVGQNAIDLLRKVERALAQIESGQYGKCAVCGGDIPVARLEILPYATECVSCAART